MSRFFTLERSTVASAVALTLSVAVLAPTESPRAQDAAAIEELQQKAAATAAESATTGFFGSNAPSAEDVQAARTGMGGATETAQEDSASTSDSGSEPAKADESAASQSETADTPPPDVPAQDASQAAEAKPADSESPAADATTENNAAKATSAEVAPTEAKPADSKTAAAKPADAKAAAAKPGESAPDDYYSKRAKEMLKADTSATDLPPHPLAAQHPDQFVVVCEAGCSHGKSAEIVYMAPKPRAAATGSAMVPTSTDAGQGTGIDCTGGCYGKMPKAYGGRADAAAAKMASPESTWMTTVSSEQPAAGVPAAAEKPVKAQSKNGGSGDWMAKIDLDQGKNGAKPAAETAPTAPATAPEAPKANGMMSKPDKVGAAAEPAAPASAKPAGSKPADAAAVAVPAQEAPKPDAAQADQVKTEAPAAAPTPEAKAEAAPATAPAAADAPAAVAADQSAVPAEAPKADAPQAEASPAETPADAPKAEAAAAAEAPKAEAAPAAAANAPAAEAEGQKAAGKTVVAALDPAAPPASEAPKAEAVPAPAAKETPAASAPVKPGLAIDGKPIDLDAKDAEVNAAVKKARAGLSDFLRAMDKPESGETNFSLKVAIRGTNGIVEHFWLVDVKREGDHLAGKINNEPEYVRGIEMGQTYEFTEAQVTDWLFKRNGKMVGNETLRPLLRRMAKEEAAPYWAMYEKP